MKEKVGEVFSIARDNAPVPGCTISKEVHSGENFHFAKAGLHSVKATKKFKMALLLTLE